MSRSQELIDIIRMIVRQEISNNAKVTVRNGYVYDASSYQISAYLDGDEEYPVEDIEGLAGFYHYAGQYVTVHTNESGTSWIARIGAQQLFPRLVVNIDTGQVLVGNGSSVPSDAGSYGQVLYSGGPSGSAYWK